LRLRRLKRKGCAAVPDVHKSVLVASLDMPCSCPLKVPDISVETANALRQLIRQSKDAYDVFDETQTKLRKVVLRTDVVTQSMSPCDTLLASAEFSSLHRRWLIARIFPSVSLNRAVFAPPAVTPWLVGRITGHLRIRTSHLPFACWCETESRQQCPRRPPNAPTISVSNF
jgi:hypothetical protein